MKNTKKKAVTTKSRWLPYILVVAVGLLVGFGGVFAVSRLGDDSPTNQGLTKTDRTVNGQPVLEDGTFVVDLINGSATPSELAVPIGSSVQFNSRDGRNHRLVIGDSHGGDDSNRAGDQHSATVTNAASSFKSEQFGDGEGYKITFSKTGTYKFSDESDSNIDIIVVAYQPKSAGS